MGLQGTPREERARDRAADPTHVSQGLEPDLNLAMPFPLESATAPTIVAEACAQTFVVDSRAKQMNKAILLFIVTSPKTSWVRVASGELCFTQIPLENDERAGSDSYPGRFSLPQQLFDQGVVPFFEITIAILRSQWDNSPHPIRRVSPKNSPLPHQPRQILNVPAQREARDHCVVQVAVNRIFKRWSETMGRAV